MEDHIQYLIEALVSKGMEVTSIPAFIRNVANAFVESPSISLSELNGHLRMLGWHGFELDNNTFFLIMALFEPDLAGKLTHCIDSTAHQAPTS
jgi:hypothetical protein